MVYRSTFRGIESSFAAYLACRPEAIVERVNSRFEIEDLDS
jgi:hypothetical protein